MTIINVNSISGINSITAQGASGIEFYDSSGNSVQSVTGDGLTVGTGATISGSTNTITASTNGSEKVRVDSSGNVGIGTDNADDKLHVLGNIVGRVTPKTFTITQGSSNFGQVDTFSINADITRIYLNHSFTSTDTGSRTYTANITSGLPTALGSRIEVEVLSARTNNSPSSVVGHQTVLQFNGTTILDSGYTTITYISPDNAYSKKLIGTAILTSEGWKLEGVVYGRDLTITDGNIKFDEGHGINFHNYGTGTNISSNLLDDYEEGTWEPRVTQGVTGTPTYANQYGWYTKIGRIVTLYFYLRFEPTGNTGSNTIFRIGNFPFPVASTYQNTFNRGMGVSNYHSIPGFTSANVSFYGGGSSNTFASIYQGNTPVGTTSSLNSEYIIGGFEYISE